MNVETEAIDINLGDVFISEDSAYMLMEVSDMDADGESLKTIQSPFQLVSLNGRGVWDGYETFNDAVNNIKELVEVEGFRHFSQNSYVLCLNRKGD